MSKFDTGFKLPTKPPRTHSKTQILWGCEDGGSQRFPKNMEIICARKYSPDPKPLDAFRTAVMEAVDRVWVVDEYFLMPDEPAIPDGRISTILDWLHTRRQ